jgi:molybdopterin-containing oxidoreductase family iron-sulfur binding subunit
MPLDLDAIRQRLADQQGPVYWRSLEELADTEEFREMMDREFPEQASEWADPVTRRRFLMLMGASLALAGVAGCSPRPAPHEKIMPYVRQPEELIPGKPLFFATAMPLAGSAVGLLVESHEGRPTKVEGNPDHPSSLGATDVFAQAAVLTLYDPDRSRTITYRGRPRSWAGALEALRGTLDRQRLRKGAGVRVLTETVSSPTLADLIGQVLKEFPQAKWYQYEPVARHNAHAGAQLALQSEGDAPVGTRYNFADADVILSLDADFLFWGPGRLRYAREFIDRRRVRVGPGTAEEQKARAAKAAMNRLYVVECMPTITGAKADHRLPLRPRDVERFARAVAAELRNQLGREGQKPPVPDAAQALQGLTGATPQGLAGRWVGPLVRDLLAHPGRSIVLAGDGQPPVVHAIAHALNHALGNVGKTVLYGRPIEARPADQLAEIAELVEEMNRGDVELLAVLGGNPVFNAPADLNFAGALEKVPFRLHLGLYQDETAVRCDWHIPEAHFLEAWGDARGHDGTATIMQPLIAPLYGGRSACELLAAFTQYPERTGYDIVRAYWLDSWRKNKGQGEFEPFWQAALRDGVVPDLGKEFAPRPASLRSDWVKRAEAARGGPPPGQGLDIVFHPDPGIFDGRFANNGWLQELPRPITRLTWDNAAIFGVETARKLGLVQSIGWVGGERGRVWVDEVELHYRGGRLTMPAFIVPGHPENAVTVHFGHGRKRAGTVGTDVGRDVYRLRTTSAPWFDGGLEVARTGNRYALACVQLHHMLNPYGRDHRQEEKRHPVHAATLAEFREKPNFAQFLEAGKELEPEVRALIPGPGEGHYPPEEPGEEEGHPGPEAPDRRLVPLSLYPEDRVPEKGYTGYRWGMGIDLTACVGCNACVVACQAENNIPVVGKTEVTRGREMHWLRIDTYYSGVDYENPPTFFQPVPCMHCEKAPCELVCPVAATAHSSDGLNDMTYNRCVGTRYCSNNCPYKVRRFNFFQYADYATESLKLLHNPNVTVRSRGVMEKCTYCVQRIRAGDIEAQKRLVKAREAARAQGKDPEATEIERANRVQDGEVRTACQAACPTGAIIFGDLNGPGREGAEHSEVYRWKEEPLNYGLLAGLNTQPRTTYLAALRNLNPELI